MDNLYVPIAVGTAVVAGSMYAMSRGSAIKSHPQLKNQSVTTERERDGESPIYRSVLVGKDGPLMERCYDDATTLHELFTRSAKEYGDRACLGTRAFNPDGSRGAYEWTSYADAAVRMAHLGSGLRSIGIAPLDRVGIYAKNCEEWSITEYGIYSQNCAIVSLYDTLGEDAVEYILNDAEISCVFVQEQNFDKLAAALEGAKTVKAVVIIGNLRRQHEDICANHGIKAFSFQQVEELGQKDNNPPTPPTTTNIASIMYTSGSTGPPKGVILTHANVIATVAALQAQGSDAFEVYRKENPNQTQLCYLPLAHIMERVSVTLGFQEGNRIGYYQGNITKLLDDVQELKPTQFVGAPRVFQKIYDKVMAGLQTSSAVKRTLFETAYAAKAKALKNGQTSPIWDVLVFKKLAARILGPNVQYIISGSAPLSAEVREFLRVVFTTDVREGYGLTESTAGCSLQLTNDPAAMSVGPPLPCVEFKLVDVAEMNYYTADEVPKGEILLRGPGVSQGYYGLEDKTAEAFRDGWFWTGDVGQVNPDGTLSIIDRTKNIFKLSHGEYIAPEKLENVLNANPFVSMIYLYGDSARAELIGVCVPEEESLMHWASNNGITGDFAEVCKHKATHDFILAELIKASKDNKFRGFEIVRDVILDPVPFSVENDLLTPSMKKKRVPIRDHYRAQIDALYEKLKQ